MGLDAGAAFANRHRRPLVLVALVMSFAGVGLVIDRPKGTVLEWLALPFLVVGGAIFAWAVWPLSGRPMEAPASVAGRFLGRITHSGRLTFLFPVIGVGVVVADLTYNLLLSATPALQTEDTIVLLGAASLFGYNLFPARFARERDFVLVFFACLNAILVVPLLVARAYYADFEKSVDVYSWVALAPETSAVLTFLGVGNTVHSVAGFTAPGLTFRPLHFSADVTLVITTSCSGIYSFGIFASAFVAFVLTEYQRLSRRVWIFLGLGLAMAYAANVLRMVVIVLVGYYTDSTQTDLQNLLLAHSYAGWVIFLGWLTLFWGVLLKVLLPEKQGAHVPQEAVSNRKARAGHCGICVGALSPAIPATMCACGAINHTKCLATEGRCPSCHTEITGVPSVVPEGQ